MPFFRMALFGDNRGMNTPLFILSLLLLVIISFVLFWGFVVWLISRVSGWQRLARHYRTPTPPKGQPVSQMLAMLGSARHRGTLTLQAAPEGLYLTVMVLFRLGHPPLLIPWSAVKRRGTSAGDLSNWLTLELGDPPVTTLRLPAALVDHEVLGQYIKPV